MAKVSDLTPHTVLSVVMSGLRRILRPLINPTIYKKKRFQVTSAAVLLVTPAVVITVQHYSNQPAHSSVTSTPPASQNVGDVQTETKTEASEAPNSSVSPPSASSNVNVSSNGGNTSIEVNGEEVPVPSNGTVHKTVTNDNGGVTDVTVTSSSSSGGSTTVNTFTNSYSNSMTNTTNSTFTSTNMTGGQ